MTLGRSIWMRVDRIHPHDLHPVGCAEQNPVPNDWIVIEPDESIDIEVVRKRLQKCGYKVST
jgi:hypothetical protein